MSLTLVALTLLLQPSSAPDARAKAEEQVRNAVIGANLAYAKNDLPVYWSFYGQDLTQFWPEGRVDLAAYKTQWEKFVKDGGRVEQADVKDLVIQIGPSNDSAVATYLLTVTTRQPDGKAETAVMQETDVLVKRLGAWKVIHLHYSPARVPAGT
jgi:ketosteroid isomerase-like protein